MVQHEAGPLARKLGQYTTLSDAELEVLGRLEGQPQTIERHDELFAEGDGDKKCYVVVDGWAACYKLLPDGRRQIINFMIRGDFLGLRSVLLRVSDHTVSAVTDLRLSTFPAADLRAVMTEHQRLAAAIFWALSRDEAIVVEHLVNLGRRNALERLAHFVLELGERLKLVGLATDEGYDCPLRQEDLADALGLTNVHVNRSLRQLRERQLVTLVNRRIQIRDMRGLAELAHFTEDYLDHEPRADGLF